MPEDIDNFLDALSYYEAGKALISDPKVQGLLEDAKEVGFDTLDSLKNFFKTKKGEEVNSDEQVQQPPHPPSALVRTMSETAFLEPKNISPLDEVTKPELKEYTIFSRIFDNTSFGVRDLSVTTTYNDRNNDNKYTLRAGDKVGFQFQHNETKNTHRISIEHNLFSGRTRASYTFRNPQKSYEVSIYQKNGDVGATVGYWSSSGFTATLSGDSHSVALSAGYTHEFSDCKLSLKGFVSTMQRNLETFSTKKYSGLVGICGTITVK